MAEVDVQVGIADEVAGAAGANFQQEVGTEIINELVNFEDGREIQSHAANMLTLDMGVNEYIDKVEKAVDSLKDGSLTSAVVATLQITEAQQALNAHNGLAQNQGGEEKKRTDEIKQKGSS